MREPPRGVESLTEAPSTGASSPRRPRQPWSPNSRLEALTDGVFAVVMTILVFQLGGSAISSAETATQLEAALLAQWPTFVSYAISFLVVGLY